METVLASIGAVHSRDFEISLTLLDKKVKYYGAIDLPNYFRAISIYLGEMLKGEDSATRERLKNDPEQETLKQEIKEI